MLHSRWDIWRDHPSKDNVDSTIRNSWDNCQWITPALQRRKYLNLNCPELAMFRFPRAPSAQLGLSAGLWDLRCFLMIIVSFSRLWSFSKEGGGHPRRACAGVAARRGNPGQEGRNQGRRANERVSGETPFLTPSSFPSGLCSMFSPCFLLIFCSLSLCICLY